MARGRKKHHKVGRKHHGGKTKIHPAHMLGKAMRKKSRRKRG
jgi:hypothetical protein